MSIPRLELCAASLFSDCIAFFLSNITNVRVRRVFCWSYSTVTLSWIRSSPHRWKTFVANRVSHIQEQVAPECWNYVDGKVNPADCASRGMFPEQFVSHSMWWAGPPWLAESNSSWPNCFSSEIPTAVTLEEKKVVYMATFSDNFLSGLLQKFSSLSKIQRIISYCLRFVNNLRNHKCEQQVGCLSYVELYKALIVTVRFVQNEVFSADILKLKEKVPCSKPFRKLASFLDEDGVLRVGGRLKHANLEFDVKHPMLLPRDHQLTYLVIQEFHNKNLHPGPRTLEYLILQQFWILSARRAIRITVVAIDRLFFIFLNYIQGVIDASELLLPI
ncbi:uncharacterized protein LOC115877948 [Sitophilus oryzae]|uniref:Uncharacterized protein LOC115877948 n=1 Tax=Sitophilus oryzae TaxID=7048 RepID=A0A6J2XFN5_SITOR|nr:uncharacterized protein LOC115877948 [Sitophilus oryzae]